MSKAGCPYDNSPMESFYGTFKAEFISKHRFLTDEELNNETIDYVYVEAVKNLVSMNKNFS